MKISDFILWLSSRLMNVFDLLQRNGERALKFVRCSNTVAMAPNTHHFPNYWNRRAVNNFHRIWHLASGELQAKTTFSGDSIIWCLKYWNNQHIDNKIQLQPILRYDDCSRSIRTFVFQCKCDLWTSELWHNEKFLLLNYCYIEEYCIFDANAIVWIW